MGKGRGKGKGKESGREKEEKRMGGKGNGTKKRRGGKGNGGGKERILCSCDFPQEKPCNNITDAAVTRK